MNEITLGNVTYRLRAEPRNRQWSAHAERGESGDRFGVDCAGASETEALERLHRWLEWQHAHTGALDALQQAERAYHRTIAGNAFGRVTDGPSAIELQKESLEQVEVARVRLDAIRTRRPE